MTFKDDPEAWLYTCPCCGYQTLPEPPPGTYNLCPICFWEDDGVQFRDPDYEGGANGPSLRQAQSNFAGYGACDEHGRRFVRPPRPGDVRDAQWRALPQPAV